MRRMSRATENPSVKEKQVCEPLSWGVVECLERGHDASAGVQRIRGKCTCPLAQNADERGGLGLAAVGEPSQHDSI
eukprot:366130-Chlamydomonas_euryale.AAC.46